MKVVVDNNILKKLSTKTFYLSLGTICVYLKKKRPKSHIMTEIESDLFCALHISSACTIWMPINQLFKINHDFLHMNEMMLSKKSKL